VGKARASLDASCLDHRRQIDSSQNREGPIRLLFVQEGGRQRQLGRLMLGIDCYSRLACGHRP
jgi:hypothetical protein